MNYVECVIPEWKRKNSKEKKEYKEQCEITRKQTIEQLLQDKESIRSGQNLSALKFLALIYFGYFVGEDRKLHPHEKLKAEVGSELSIIALEGFSEIIKRPDLPSPTEIAIIVAKNHRCNWWFAILAGMDEAWQKEEGLDVFSDKLLKTALALAMLLSEIKTGHGKNAY